MGKTLADVAASYLRERNGTEHADLKDRYYWSLDTGMLDDLHEIYDRWLEETGNKRGGHAHTSVMRNIFYPRYAVMKALVHSKSGQKLFDHDHIINYPGIVNRWCPVATLREEYR